MYARETWESGENEAVQDVMKIMVKNQGWFSEIEFK